jgi:hypothetical protein
MKKQEFKVLQNRIGLLLCIFQLVFVSSFYCQGVFIEHFNNIISDTVSNNEIGIKEVWYSSEKKANRRKGIVNSIKYYKNKKLIYKKLITGNMFNEFFYVYDEKGKLKEEYKYSLGKFSNSYVRYYYDTAGNLEYTINTTDERDFKVVYTYDVKLKITESNLYVDNKWHYFKKLNLYEESPNLIEKISLVTDSSSNFRKFDTLSIEYKDLKEKSNIYIAKSKGLNIFRVEFYAQNGTLLTQSSQTIEEKKYFFSEYKIINYINNDDFFKIEKVFYNDKVGYTYFQKIPFSLPVQPLFKFPEKEKEK